MAWRSILIHLDESARCAQRVDIAARLAREHEAHLLGVAPAGVVQVPMRVSRSLTGVANFAEVAQASLNERAAALVREFERRAQELRVASFEGRVDEDHSVESLVRHARVHDLVVLGQTDRSSAAARLEIDIAEQVFMQAGTPALVVPLAGTFETVGRCVAVAWNGSREAALAVHGAMPLLRSAERVHLICFDVRGDLHHLSPQQLNDAQQWLARHGVEVHPQRTPVHDGAGHALLSRVRELGADLVVMGGYGHSRTTEFLLGGATRHLMGRMTVPVLLAH